MSFRGLPLRNSPLFTLLDYAHGLRLGCFAAYHTRLNVFLTKGILRRNMTKLV